MKEGAVSHPNGSRAARPLPDAPLEPVISGTPKPSAGNVLQPPHRALPRVPATLLVALAITAGSARAQRPPEASATVLASATIVAPVSVETPRLTLGQGAAGGAWLEADVAVGGPSPHALAVVVTRQHARTRWAWQHLQRSLEAAGGGPKAEGREPGSPGDGAASTPRAPRSVTRTLTVDAGGNGEDGAVRVSYVVAVLY